MFLKKYEKNIAKKNVAVSTVGKNRNIYEKIPPGGICGRYLKMFFSVKDFLIFQ